MTGTRASSAIKRCFQLQILPPNSFQHPAWACPTKGQATVWAVSIDLEHRPTPGVRCCCCYSRTMTFWQQVISWGLWRRWSGEDCNRSAWLELSSSSHCGSQWTLKVDTRNNRDLQQVAASFEKLLRSFCFTSALKKPYFSVWVFPPSSGFVVLPKQMEGAASHRFWCPWISPGGTIDSWPTNRRPARSGAVGANAPSNSLGRWIYDGNQKTVRRIPMSQEQWRRETRTQSAAWLELMSLNTCSSSDSTGGVFLDATLPHASTFYPVVGLDVDAANPGSSMDPVRWDIGIDSV